MEVICPLLAAVRRKGRLFEFFANKFPKEGDLITDGYCSITDIDELFPD